MENGRGRMAPVEYRYVGGCCWAYPRQLHCSHWQHELACGWYQDTRGSGLLLLRVLAVRM